MALGILAIIFIAIIITAVILQFLLYKGGNKSKNNNIVFIGNMLLGVLVSIMLFTSLPSNYISQKVIAAAWGVIAVLAILVRSKPQQSGTVSKLMLTVSIIGGLAQLLI